MTKDIDFKSTKVNYGDLDTIHFYGAVTKSNDSEVVILLDLDIWDLKNTYKIYTLYKDIGVGDTVIMYQKQFLVINLSNHYECGLDYMELFTLETNNKLNENILKENKYAS